MQDNTKKTDPLSPSTRYVLVIDLGTGGAKTAIVSDTGKVVASAKEPVSTHLLPDGGAEQDPHEWWDSTRKAARRVVSECGIPPEQIVAVACDSQYSVTVPVDAQGEPLMNAVHWTDTRGGKYNRQISKGFPSVEGYGLRKALKWVKLTGLAPTHSGVCCLGHILFIKNERPDIYADTENFLEPMDYLTARFTGRMTATQQTSTLALVVSNQTWSSLEYSDALLKMAGLEKEKFPELIPNNGIVGPLLPQVAQELGLLPSTQVIAGLYDTHGTAIGSGAVNDFDGVICIGTSLVMTCHVPFKKTNLSSSMVSIPSPVHSKYFLLGEQGLGGKCLEFYLNNIVFAEDEFETGQIPEDVYERFYRMAARVPAGSDGVLFLPWLNGLVVPDQNDTVRGGFMNLSLNTTRSHMTRAIMEGLAYNSRWTRGPAEKFIGRKFEKFRFIGGGALSDEWAQIHADVLGIPIHQLDDPVNATARGTAFNAFVILGHRSLAEVPDLVQIRKVYEPDLANQAVYDKMYDQYMAAYRKNKSIFHALNTRSI